MGERFGSREISKVVLKEIATGKPVLYLTSLKVSTNEITADTVHARGGSGNPKRLSWDSNKEVVFNMEDALISPEGLAILAGKAMETGSKESHEYEFKTLVAGGTTPATVVTTLDKTPSAGADMFIFETVNGYDIGEPLVLNTDYTIDGKVITFLNNIVGDKVIIDYYYDSPVNTKTIKITSGDFPGYYKLEADTLWKMESDGEDYPAKYTMPKIKIQPGFTITGAAEGDPSVFTFNVEAYPNSDEEIEIIDILEAD